MVIFLRSFLILCVRFREEVILTSITSSIVRIPKWETILMSIHSYRVVVMNVLTSQPVVYNLKASKKNLALKNAHEVLSKI